MEARRCFGLAIYSMRVAQIKIQRDLLLEAFASKLRAIECLQVLIVEQIHTVCGLCLSQGFANAAQHGAIFVGKRLFASFVQLVKDLVKSRHICGFVMLLLVCESRSSTT